MRSVLVAAALAAPPVAVFVYPTLALIGGNPDYFAGDYGAGLYLYALAAAVLVVGAVCYRLRDGAGGGFALTCYLLAGPGWLAYELLRPATGPARGLAAVAVAVGAVAVVLVRRAPLEEVVSALGVAGAILLVGLGLSTAAHVAGGAADGAAVRGSAAQAHDRAGGGDAGGEDLPNVYHLILDEFQTEMFAHVLDDGVRRDLRGFTYFPETTTPYGRTQMALAAMYATSSYDYAEPAMDFARRAVSSDSSSLAVLRAAGYRSLAYGHRMDIFREGWPFEEVVLHTDLGDFFVGDRRGIALSMWIYATLPRRVAAATIPDHHFQQLTGDMLLPDTAPALSANSFQTFIATEADRPASGRYTYLHLILPHFPYVLTEDCRYRGGIRTDVGSQTRCTLGLLREFTDVLDELGRFTDATIVVHADHGGRFALEDGRLRNVEDQGHLSEAFSTARSRTLLLVKPSGVARDDAPRLRTSHFPAEITDVMPTIFASVGLDWQGERRRVSLLDEAARPPGDGPVARLRHYHFYDRHRDSLVDDRLARYVIADGWAAFEREIDVPTR